MAADDLSNAMKMKNGLNTTVEVQVYGTVTGTEYALARISPGETKVIDWGNSWYNKGKTVYVKVINGEWQNLPNMNVNTSYFLEGVAGEIKAHIVVTSTLANGNTLELKNSFHAPIEVKIYGTVTGTYYCEPTQIAPFESKAVSWGDNSTMYNSFKTVDVRFVGSTWQNQPGLQVGSSYVVCGNVNRIVCVENISYQSTLDEIGGTHTQNRQHSTQDQVVAHLSEYVYNMTKPEHEQLPKSLRRHYEIVMKYHEDDDHFVCVRPNNRPEQMYIVFRGTSGVMNALTDVCAVPNRVVEFNDVGMPLKVHSGMASAVINCLPALLPLCEELDNIILGGHSLGGGMATLCTSYLVAQYGNTKSIRCVTYASPQVFAHERGDPTNLRGGAKEIFDTMNQICTNYVCGYDCVPRSPLLVTTSSAKHVMGQLVSTFSQWTASQQESVFVYYSQKIHGPWKMVFGEDVYSPIEFFGLVLWGAEKGMHLLGGKMAGDGGAALTTDILLAACENSKMFKSYICVGTHVVFDRESKRYYTFTQEQSNRFCKTNILRTKAQCTDDNIWGQVTDHFMANYLEHFTAGQKR